MKTIKLVSLTALLGVAATAHAAVDESIAGIVTDADGLWDTVLVLKVGIVAASIALAVIGLLFRGKRS